MWKLVAVLCAFALTACSSVPPFASSDSAAQWSAYRSEVLARRDRGVLTAVEAEQSMRDKYHELFGADRTMDRALAYDRRLYLKAQAGKLPLAEAESRANARIDVLMQRRTSRQAFDDWLDSPYPGEPGATVD